MMKKLKTLCAVLLAALTALSFGSVYVAAEGGNAVLDEGFCGAGDTPERVSWVLTDDGVLRISGDGKIVPADWERTINTPGRVYRKGEGLVKEIVIEEGVTGAERCNTFQFLYALERVYLPASMEKFDDCTFHTNPCVKEFIVAEGNRDLAADEYGCLYTKDMREMLLYTAGSERETYEIPQGVTRIAAAAFEGTDAIKKVVIPETVTSVGGLAFSACISLEEAYLPARLESLGAGVFAGCRALKRTSLPQGCAAIPNALFALTAIEEIGIPEGVETVGEQAFISCASLAAVRLPGSVTEIGAEAFKECENLAHVYVNMTAAQWENQVSVAAGNEDLLGAAFRFIGEDGHLWDEGTVTAEPTAHAPGEIKYQCLACGASYTADLEPAGRHDWKAIPVSDAGLKKGRCWLDLTADAALAGSSGGAWYADYDTCVLRHDTADGTAYYGADVFVRCVREVGVTWQPAATSTNGLADGDWYVDTAALIEAVGGDKTEAEKREAKELLETCFRFFVNPGGNLYQIRYEYADLPDGSGGKISGSVDFPLSLLAGEEDAFSYDYETLRQCIRQYEAAAPDPGQGEDDANGGVFSGIVAFVKGAISAILSFFRRLFKTYK